MGSKTSSTRPNAPIVAGHCEPQRCLMSSMQYSKMRQSIDESVEFPITHTRLMTQWGETELATPTGDSVPVSEILDRPEESSYSSTDMLHTTIMGNLDDRFIGHKYSDERGGALTCPDPKSSTRQSL